MVRVIFSVDKAHNKRFDFDFLFIFYIKWAAFWARKYIETVMPFFSFVLYYKWGKAIYEIICNLTIHLLYFIPKKKYPLKFSPCDYTMGL